MSKRTRLQVQGSTLPRMDRADLWVSGYHAAMISTFTGELEIQDEATPVFGYDSVIETRVLNAGQLKLDQYEHPDKTHDILDVLCGIDPRSAGLRGYKPVGTFICDVVRCIKHPTLEHYISAELFPAWNVVLKPKTGDPKAAGQRMLDGRCALPLEFKVGDPDNDAVAVCFDVANLVASGPNMAGSLASNSGVATLTQIPASVPSLGGKYALTVEVQQRDGSNKIVKSARLTPTATMVDTNGLVTITPSDLAGSPFATDATMINYAWVTFLKYSQGSLSDPTLLGSGLDCRGRWDTTPPAAPTGLTAGTLTTTTAPMTWTDHANNATAYEVQKSVDAGVTWISLTTSLLATATAYTATGLTTGTAYQFRVRALAGDEASAFSNVLSVTTP